MRNLIVIIKTIIFTYFIIIYIFGLSNIIINWKELKTINNLNNIIIVFNIIHGNIIRD